MLCSLFGSLFAYINTLVKKDYSKIKSFKDLGFSQKNEQYELYSGKVVLISPTKSLITLINSSGTEFSTVIIN